MTRRADVVVVGGGPGGHAAALAARRGGATTVLVEDEALGGTCVHHACVPTNIMLGSVGTWLEARELDTLGVFGVADRFNLGRAAARRARLVAMVASGVEASLLHAGVEIVRGHGALAGGHRVAVDGAEPFEAAAVVLATGARWNPPSFPGVADSKVVTVDVVQSLTEVPGTVVVADGDGGAGESFFFEYAFLLAGLGAGVTVAGGGGGALVPGLDPEVDGAARAVLEAVGVKVSPLAVGALAGSADLVVVTDCRVPTAEGLGLETVGLDAVAAPAVDGSARTPLDWLYAAGDLAGPPLLTSAAIGRGQVAGTNAAGGAARYRVGAVPRVLHTLPPVAWIGMGEEAGRAAGRAVRTGYADLAHNVRAAALGAREGVVKVVADDVTGEILGVQVVGPGAEEIIAVAALAMGAELTVDDLAAPAHWHPSVSEALSEAAGRASGS